jgi:hypothetical protein
MCTTCSGNCILCIPFHCYHMNYFRKPTLEELVRRNIYRSRDDGPTSTAAALLSDFMGKKRMPVGELLRAELSKPCMMWTQMLDVGSAPTPRNCHTWTLVGQRLFVSGGFTQPPDPPCLPLAALDLDASEWSTPASCISAPLPMLLPTSRYAHSAVGFKDSFLIVFGGYGVTGKWLHDLWLADLRLATSTAPLPPAINAMPRIIHSSAGSAASGWPHSVTWHATAPVGVLPPPRAAHTAVLCESCMLVFGGNDGAGLFNDSWLLRLSDAVLKWQPMLHLGTPPTPRSGHSSVMFKTQMVVFGGGEGWGGHCFNDLYCGHVDLDARRIVWMRPSFSGTPPPPRTGHTASGRFAFSLSLSLALYLCV